MSGCKEKGCWWCITYDEDREEWCAFCAVPCSVISECGISKQLKEKE